MRVMRTRLHFCRASVRVMDCQEVILRRVSSEHMPWRKRRFVCIRHLSQAVAVRGTANKSTASQLSGKADYTDK